MEVGLALTVAVTDAAGLGLPAEAVRRCEAPVQAPAATTGTSSTIAARRAENPISMTFGRG
jgi:hypothetical protein